MAGRIAAGPPRLTRVRPLVWAYAGCAAAVFGLNVIAAGGPSSSSRSLEEVYGTSPGEAAECANFAAFWRDVSGAEERRSAAVTGCAFAPADGPPVGTAARDQVIAEFVEGCIRYPRMEGVCAAVAASDQPRGGLRSDAWRE